jgi:hypothetical protein
MDAVALIQSPKDPRWPRESNPRVSEELEDALMMMLSKDLKARLTSYETRTLLKFLDENNALLHSEPTRRQRRANAKTARRVLKEIRRLRDALIAAGEGLRVADVRKLYTLYEDCAELQPRDEEAGVNERLHLLEEAMAFHRAVVAPRGDAFLKGVRDRISLIEKRRALEMRRLERRGFKRIVRRPRRWGRPLVFTAAGLLIVTLAVLSGLRFGEDFQSRRRIDVSLGMAEAALQTLDLGTARSQLALAVQDAQDLPLSSPAVRRLQALTARLEAADRVDEASSRADRLRKKVEAKDWPAAAVELAEARRLIGGEFPEALDEPVSQVRARLDKDERLLDRHLADVRVFAGLVRQLDDLEAQSARLSTPPLKGDLDPLNAKLDGVYFKLVNPEVVRPDLIGPAHAAALQRASALRARLKP